MHPPSFMLVAGFATLAIIGFADDPATAVRPAKDAKTAADTNRPPALSVRANRVTAFGGEDEDLGLQAVLTAGDYKLRFHVPTGWKLRQQPDRPSFTLSHATIPGTISLALETEANRKEKGYTHDALRPAVLARYKEAKIVAEYESVALGTNALVFELDLPLRGDPWATRMVCFPSPAGEFQASAIAPKDQSDETRSAMMSIVSSLELRKASEAFEVIRPNPGI